MLTSFLNSNTLRAQFKKSIEEKHPQSPLLLEALGAIGHPDDLEFIRSFLGHVFWAENAFMAIGYGQFEEMIPFLIGYLTEPRNKYRAHAAWCLGEFKNPAVLPHLLNGTRDPIRMVAYYCSQALLKFPPEIIKENLIGGQNKLPLDDSDEWITLQNIDLVLKTFGTGARDILLAALNEIENPRLQASLISCFNHIEPDEEVNRVLIRGLKNPDPRVRANAIESLLNKELTEQEKKNYFLGFLKDLDNRSCANAILHLYPIIPEECQRQIEIMIQGMNTNWVRSAIFVITRLGLKKGGVDYQFFLKHSESRVRSYALKALSFQPDWVDSLILSEGFKDSDAFVRQSALELYSQLPKPPILLEPFKTVFQKEKHPRVLFALMDCFKGGDAPDDETLNYCAKHTEYLVRTKALELLGRKGRLSPLISLKSFYENLFDETGVLYQGLIFFYDFENQANFLLKKLQSDKPEGAEIDTRLKALVSLNKYLKKSGEKPKTSRLEEKSPKEVIKGGEFSPNQKPEEKVALDNYQPISDSVVQAGDKADFFAEGQFCFQNGNFKEAQFYFKKHLKKDPENIQCRYRLAVCYFRLERFKECEFELKTITSRSSHLEARILLGNLFLKSRKWDGVIDLLKDLENQDNQDIKRYLALAYFNQGLYEKAGKFFHYLLQNQPENMSNAYHLGMCYYHLKEFPRATSQFEHILRLSEPSSRLHQTVSDHLQKIESFLNNV